MYLVLYTLIITHPMNALHMTDTPTLVAAWCPPGWPPDDPAESGWQETVCHEFTAVTVG